MDRRSAAFFDVAIRTLALLYCSSRPLFLKKRQKHLASPSATVEISWKFSSVWYDSEIGMGRIRKDTAPLAQRYPRRHFQICPGDWLTMDAGSVTEALERRFHTRAAHTVIAKVKPARQPVLFSYVASAVPIAEKTVAPPIEAAFAVHVHHQPLSAAETWIDNRHAKVPRIGTGGICIFDLQTAPVALIREPFAFSRFHITQAALDEVAYQSRVPRVQLRIPVFGRPDAVLYNLALALNARLAIYAEEKDSLFADYVALAFHEHVVRTYGDRALLKTWKGALSPRRLRAVMELMTENLGESLSIKEIASHIDVAPSYFVRAFREAVGEPPHRWLMQKRIERAKSLLRSSEIAISDVSAICGFSDQSHFTRVFRQIEGITPYSWRRNCD